MHPSLALVAAIADASPGDRTPQVDTRELKRRVDLFSSLLYFFTILFILFLFCLPILSRLFNDVLGYTSVLCNAPAETLTCGSKVDYKLIALNLGRWNNGTLVGCGCGEGIFRDWACAVNTESFSISYFISTAPGTGAMAALSIWPLLGSWFFGAGMMSRLSWGEGEYWPHIDYLAFTLMAYQFFYGLFLINTTCVNGPFHTVSVVLFNLSAVLHYLAVARHIGTSTPAGVHINVCVAIGVVAIGLGSIWPIDTTWLGQHAFWLGECIGLSVGMSIAPILMYHGFHPGRDAELAGAHSAAPLFAFMGPSGWASASGSPSA